MKYLTHGSFSLKRYEDILLLTLSGKTNVELFRDLDEALVKERLKFENRKWALVIDLRDWQLGPPEFFQAMQKHDKESTLKGRRADAIVLIIESHLTKDILSHMKNENPPEKIFYVENFEAAVKQIKKLGFSSYRDIPPA